MQNIINSYLKENKMAPSSKQKKPDDKDLDQQSYEFIASLFDSDLELDNELVIINNIHKKKLANALEHEAKIRQRHAIYNQITK